MFEKTIDSIRLLFLKEKEPYLRLKRILGFLPHNIEIYRIALMHKSAGAKDKGNRRINNERLEFLGDAVLSSVVADILYKRYPNKQEGFLTTLRSKLVKRDTLNELAVKIGLDKLVLHNEQVQQAHNSYMNGNAFEAFFGAIYLDQGYGRCYSFIRDVVLGRYIDVEEVSKTEENYKSKLIEWCQKYQLQIQFDIVSEEVLADHNTPKFVSRVTVEGIYCGSGDGYSKKESHQNAARQAVKHIKRDVAFANSLIEARTKRTNQQAVPESGKNSAGPAVLPS